MKIFGEGELAARLDFRSPLHPEPETRASVWCIPFEYGGLTKGTRISIAKAKEISAELRALVADAEMRELRKAFDDERKRGDDLSSQLSKAWVERDDALNEVTLLKKRRKR